ncbi:MAG: 16S rRNA (adenine(1518)-N(6)/adenine(1519)-N(6))-dimethyltransferase RsmA [Treponema sp.]|nr:16S rRNA (adenine(1518)-N(6)/adenine(1519)-N(6))-dimethyltransferase RsmA [Treponema sp.]
MILNYNSAQALREYLDKEHLGMQKKFGQNFLINPQVRNDLVQALGAPCASEVWEIGPGLGAMTALLLDKCLIVKAFEIDKGFIRALKEIFAENKNFSLIEGDAMKTWVSHLPAAKYLFGNLPYNVAAALIADFIERGNIFTRAVVTVQKEVALRMAASAGSPDYSSFSVLCASVYKIKPLMVIHRDSFYPQPNVDSMAVLLEKKEKIEYPAVFYPLVRALFSSRRKTVKNNLLSFLSSRFNKQAQTVCADILSQNNLSGNERAEKLDLNTFLSLAKSIDNMRI